MPMRFIGPFSDKKKKPKRKPSDDILAAHPRTTSTLRQLVNFKKAIIE